MRNGAMSRQLRYGAVITAAILSLMGAQSGMAEVAPSAVGPYGPNSRGEPPPPRSSTSSSSLAKTAPSIISSPPMRLSPVKRCGTFFRKAS